jgi:hypothetical protein
VQHLRVFNEGEAIVSIKLNPNAEEGGAIGTQFYLLSWYKSANTDAATGATSTQFTTQFSCFAGVQKYKH